MNEALKRKISNEIIFLEKEQNAHRSIPRLQVKLTLVTDQFLIGAFLANEVAKLEVINFG